MLESGKNVVTPLGWFYPFRSTNVASLEAACRKGRRTLHGTGIHPGGITERFPLMVSALSRAITHVRAEEFSDIRTLRRAGRDLRGDAVREDAGAGAKAARWRSCSAPASCSRSTCWPTRSASRSTRRSSTKHEMAVATRPIESPIGTIEPGPVAAQRFTWQGTVRGEPVITVRVNWLMGDERPRAGVDASGPRASASRSR